MGATHTIHANDRLEPGCPRCEEHARHPFESLDEQQLARLWRGEVNSPLDADARGLMLRQAREAQELVTKVNRLKTIERQEARRGS